MGKWKIDFLLKRKPLCASDRGKQINVKKTATTVQFKTKLGKTLKLKAITAAVEEK